MSDTTAYLLTLACPDAPGIVAAVANGIAGLGGNILSNAQFSEPSIERFCMRMRYEAPTQEPDAMAATLRDGLPVDDDIELVVHEADYRTPTLLMVSKYDHCLRDLLYRWHAGELPVDIRMVVSNHWDLQEVAANYHVPFVHIPVNKDTKATAEAKLMELVDEHDIELVVLARYMQILSDDLCRQLEGQIINIHHSFLPGVQGRAALPPGVGAGGQGDRRDRPLRHRGPRRGTHHRPGRRAGHPRPHPRRPGRHRPRCRTNRAQPGRPCPRRTADLPLRRPHGRLQLTPAGSATPDRNRVVRAMPERPVPQRRRSGEH